MEAAVAEEEFVRNRKRRKYWVLVALFPLPRGGGGGGGKATISTVVVTNRRLGLVVSGLVGGVTVGKPFFLPFPLATRIGKLHKRVSCTLCSGVATNTSRKTIHTLGDSDASDYFFDG